MKPRPIIIDTDPGIDDAAAIAIAILNPNLDIKLITTVGANVEVEKTTLNALKLVEFFDVDIPVAKGCGEPLLRKLEPCPEIHGVTGMDGYDFPPVQRKILDVHAVEAMRRVLMDSGEKITLVALGTYTNVAILFRMYPEVKEHIEEIVVMGGGLKGGNTNSTAEFNIYNDPHAAEILFKSGLPITMLGLNVTNDSRIYREGCEKMNQSGRTGHMLYSLFTRYKGGDLDAGLRIHDAGTMAYLLKPELYQCEMHSIEVATEGVASGTTVSDPRAVAKGEKVPNVNVCTKVDAKGFEEWFLKEICG